MNKRPAVYLQTDPRWAGKPYRVRGEDATIGGSGCGPTCAAMLIETLTGKTYTPEDACRWSVEHGYKALNQGTYYGYFKPQFDVFGIRCEMLSWESSYGKPDHLNHQKAFEMLREGYYLIVLMGKGLWTSSGHFVVAWWEDGTVCINDPASVRTARVNGDPGTFRAQAKYYWWIDARAYNQESEHEDMDVEKLTNHQLLRLAERIDEARAMEAPADWSEEARGWAEENNLIVGDENGNKKYRTNVTCERLIQLLYNLVHKVL